MNKYYDFVRKHTAANTLLTVLVFSLFTALSFVSVAYAADGGAIGAINFTSIEGFMGFGLGASAGYAFSQKTTVLALRERVEELKRKVEEYDELKTSALERDMADRHG
jgi:hypothetical protein